MTDTEREIIDDLYFKRAFEWIGKPIMMLADTEKKLAIDRLNAIPSEIEVIKYLHDIGKVLYIEDVPIFHIGSSEPIGILGTEYSNSLDYYEGVDIRFVEANRPDINYTYLAGIDVKNVGLDENGNDYENVYLETQKQNKLTKEWKFNGWATSLYNEAKHNRYLAFVRNGKEFGGQLATETNAYNENNTEKENKRDLIKYYADHQELLTHDIMLIHCDDVKAYLDYTGGTELTKRKYDMIQRNAKETKAITHKFEYWDKYYARVMVTWNSEWNRWNAPEQLGRRQQTITAKPIRRDGRSDETLQRDEQRIKKLAEDQKAQLLTAEQFLKLEGIPERFKSKDELISEWREKWRLVDLFTDVQLNYGNVIPDGEKKVY